MNKFKEKLVNKWLEKDGLVCVPASWQTEYVKLAGDKIRSASNVALVVDEYNKLLKQYYEKISMKELKDELKAAGITKIPKNIGRDELVNMCYNEYYMEIKK